jgi:uracil-DNA glycosylase family protein
VTTREAQDAGAQPWVPRDADLDALRAAAPGCRGCELWEPATQVVFSSGEAGARVALVGEQPGDVEDREGVPFVGPAGRLLQRAVKDAGLRWEDLYVTNAVKHFRFTVAARGKRRLHAKPEIRHIRACRPWLEAEIGAVDPGVVVVLGATAATAILGPTFRVTKQRGELLDVEFAGARRRCVPTVHPSSILRGPDDARAAAYEAFVADLAVAAAV